MKGVHYEKRKIGCDLQTLTIQCTRKRRCTGAQTLLKRRLQHRLRLSPLALLHNNDVSLAVLSAQLLAPMNAVAELTLPVLLTPKHSQAT